MESPGTYASLWTRSGLWGILAITGIVSCIGVKKAAEHARQTAVLIDKQSGQLSQFQSEEATFENRLSTAGLSLTAFESDVAVKARSFFQVAQLLEQEFPGTKIRFQISPQPLRNRLRTSINKNVQPPFTTEAIEQASALSFAPVSDRGSGKPFSSAQGATASNALTSLDFSVTLTMPKEIDVFVLLNRLIHLIPGVITFDHIDLHKITERELLSDPQQNGKNGGYEANVRGRIATHPDEAQILLGA